MRLLPAARTGARAFLLLSLAATLGACSNQAQADAMEVVNFFIVMMIVVVAAVAAVTLLVVVMNIVCLVRGKPSVVWGLAAIGVSLFVGLRVLVMVLASEGPDHSGRIALVTAVVVVDLAIAALGYFNVRGFMKAL